MPRHNSRARQARQTDFGFREVGEDEKTRLVREVFDNVASRYDLMNDLMSGGIHRRWKADLIARLQPRPGEFLLDLAGGTGDIARRFLGRAGKTGQVIVCDINASMVAAGRDRALDDGVLSGITWLVGNAEELPIADSSIDCCTISFGLRNVTHKQQALEEARRVLKPGGRFFCLEFSRVEAPVLRQLYDIYSFNVLPRLGAVIARDRDAYQYLVESIRRFPPQAELAAMMNRAASSR